MTDPTRLRESEDGLKVALLDSARADGLDDAQRNRIRAAIGVGTALALTATTPLAAAATGKGASAWLGGWALKAGLVVSVVGAATMVVMLQSAPALPARNLTLPSQPKAPATSPIPTQAEPPKQELVETVRVDPNADKRVSSEHTRRKVVTATQRAAGSQHALQAEVAQLDLVRQALTRADRRAATQALHTYRRQFARGSLRDEAALLSIELRAMAGEASQARAEAAEFIGSHPDSPYRARIMGILQSLPGEP